MNIKVKELCALGFGLGVVCAIGAGIFWITDHPDVSDQAVATAPNYLEESPGPTTNANAEALTAELEFLKSERADWEHNSAAMENQLSELRAQLAELSRNQEATARDVDYMAATGTANVDLQTADGTDEASGLTPEEEIEQLEAESQAQAELLAATVLAEEIDSEWATSAQVVLDQAFQSSEADGINLVAAECRTSACRLELSLDGSLPVEDGFRKLVYLSPWQGQAFVQIDDDGSAVVFLAREGYSLVPE